MDYPIILVLDQDSLDWAEDLIRTTFPKEAVGEVENSEAPLRVLKYAAALARSLSAHINDRDLLVALSFMTGMVSGTLDQLNRNGKTELPVEPFQFVLEMVTMAHRLFSDCIRWEIKGGAAN